jgi:hypothetical protein
MITWESTQPVNLTTEDHNMLIINTHCIKAVVDVITIRALVFKLF